jgi:alkylated DNA repair protein alkB family protein 1
MQHLDPHQRPPEGIRAVYKKYQKMGFSDLEHDVDIIDLPGTPGMALPTKLHVARRIKTEDLAQAFQKFAGGSARESFQHQTSLASIAVYEHDDMPGKASAWLKC